MFHEIHRKTPVQESPKGLQRYQKRDSGTGVFL